MSDSFFYYFMDVASLLYAVVMNHFIAAGGFPATAQNIMAYYLHLLMLRAGEAVAV
jgi:hypothetical protein